MEPHVLATFSTRADALVAVQEAGRRLPDHEVALAGTDDALDALALGQRDEIDESVPMIAGGLFTGPFARGALVWGIVGFVAGAAFGALFGVFAEPGWASTWQLVLAFAFAGALGVSSATFIIGAGAQAVKEGETTPEDPTAVVRVELDGADPDPIVGVLAEIGARSTHVVDRPVPRPATDDVEAPRPVRPILGEGGEQKAQSDAGFEADLPTPPTSRRSGGR
jgi:hypothetical protein